MKRRAFLKGLGALIAAPVAAKAVVEEDEILVLEPKDSPFESKNR